MRLRTKFAVVFLVVTLVLSTSVFVAVEFYKRDAVAESRANVNETATLVADQVDAAVREHEDYVGLVASRPEAAQFGRTETFLEAFLTNSRFYAAQIVAANGSVLDFRGDVTVTQRRDVLGADRRNATYVGAALEGRTYVGEVERVDGTDEYILVLSAPIFEDGEVKGVLAGAIFLDGQTVFDALPPLDTSGQTVSVTTAEELTLHGGERRFAAAVTASATVESTGWTVTVSEDRTPLDRRLQNLALFQAGQLGLVVLMMAGFGYWQYTASLRQTERLLDAFTDLGEGEYGRSVSLRGGAEWERIGTGFNDMVSTLRARERALRERTQRLEVMYRVLRHNLRNQLSVVITYADLIADTSEDEQIRTAVHSLLDAGHRLGRLSERTRQIETALKGDREPIPVELTAIVVEVLDDLEESYPSVAFETSIPNEAWARSLPSVRLAVVNAIENACEHNDSEHPWVEITVDTVEGPIPDSDPSIGGGGDLRTGTPDEMGTNHDRGEYGLGRADVVEGSGGPSERRWVRVRIADNGPGIPEADVAAIRAGRETELEHASGLGLWLIYWILDGSDGELRFADRESGGSCVELYLPQCRPEAAADPTTTN